MTAQSDNPVHPLDAIASRFKHSEDLQPSPQDPKGDTAHKDISNGVSAPPLMLPKKIQSPAMILSWDLRIVWQNPPAAIQLWQRREETMEDIGQLDIFDVVLSPKFQNQVRNWRQWMAFFIKQALNMMPMEALERLISKRDDRQKEILQAMLTDFNPTAEHDTFSGNLQQIMSEDLCVYYHVIGVNFDRGRLFVFDAINPGDEHEGNRTQHPLNSPPAIVMRTHKHPSKIHFYVLCARLNNADSLCDEMLAKDYVRLLNRLWGIAKDIIEQHDGLFVQNESSVAIGYFVSSEVAQQKALDIIQCALELKNQMNALGREWKIQMSWLHDIELNVGIHTGTEYVTSLPSSLGDNLLPLGNTLPLANHLSAMAEAGQIWTTKTVIDQIAEDEIETLRFGIFRNEHPRQIFVPNSFIRIGDLTRNGQAKCIQDDEFLPIPATLVFDCQGK